MTCSPTRSKDDPLQRNSKFTLVPVFYPCAKIHSCVLLSSRPLSPLMDPKSLSHPDTRTTHVSSIQDYICDSWCLSVQSPNVVGQFSQERKTLQGRADPRRMSSESGMFSCQQEGEASMRLLADGPCHFLTGCVLFWEMDPVLFG